MEKKNAKECFINQSYDKKYALRPIEWLNTVL